MNLRAAVKRPIKRLLRPAARPVHLRIDHGVRTQVDPLRVDISNLQGDISNLQGNISALHTIIDPLPTILSALSNQSANSRASQRRLEAIEHLIQNQATYNNQVADRVNAVENRIEFVRKEIMLELHYDDAASSNRNNSSVRIVNPARLMAAGPDIRLNLGAGYRILPDYLNVDSRMLEGIDIVADANGLPFEKATVAEIFSAHFLEHFPREQLRRSLLPYLVSLLKDGGRFVAVVPDMETMVAECSAGRMSYEDFFEVTYGGQEYEGDFHFTGFTERSLQELLAEVGLEDFHVTAKGRRNGLCYEMEVVATREGSRSA